MQTILKSYLFYYSWEFQKMHFIHLSCIQICSCSLMKVKFAHNFCHQTAMRSQLLKDWLLGKDLFPFNFLL